MKSYLKSTVNQLRLFIPHFETCFYDLGYDIKRYKMNTSEEFWALISELIFAS